MISRENIPQHWNYLPLRSIFYERKESNKSLELDFILSIVKDIGVIPYTEKGNVGNKSKDDLSQYKVARKDDLVLNKMNAVIGSLGISNYDGLVSPIYLVLALIEKQKFNVHYFGYFFQIKQIQEGLAQYAYGIMKIRESIDYIEFKKMKLPIPPLQEQNKIVEFLDYKLDQIEEFIENKTKFIELLKEQKEAVINQAITKGIDRSVAYKDSEIEWLGEIPKHWEVKKFKFLARITNGQDQSLVSDSDGEYPIFGSGGIFGRSSEYLYDQSSVLLGRKGTIDKPLYVESPFWTVDTMFYTKIFKNTFPKYFYYLCKTIDFKRYVSGSAIPSMTQTDLHEIKFAVAPYKEQIEIVEYIENELNQIDQIIEKTTKEIELIREYKTSLISEAVSGKMEI